MRYLILAGCGAIGSHLAMSLAAPEQSWYLFDDDRVGDENILTSAYSTEHIGTMKVHALAEMMHRKVRSSDFSVEVVDKRVEWASNLIRWQREHVVLDCFDNPIARSFTSECGQTLETPVLHVGVTPERIGVAHWEGTYQHAEIDEAVRNVVCTHELGQQIIQLTAVTAAAIVREFWRTGQQRNLTILERGRWLE